MIILALDATAIASSVAILRDGVCLCKAQNLDGNTHSCTLLPTVGRLLKQTGLSIGDIDLFAASAGPGSFTGVRIGAATLKGLAFGQNKPCVPVSALHALAYNLRGTDGLVCALMDARRGQFYTATFGIENGRVTRLTPDAAESGEEIAARFADCPSVTLVGDGAEIARPYFGENAHLCAPAYRLCDGESVARLAAEQYARGQSVSDAEFAPTYLRLPQAERERLEKSKNGEKK